MQLPAFISSAVSFFASAESKLDAIAKYQSEASDLKAQVAKLTGEAEAREAKFTSDAAEFEAFKTEAKKTQDAHAAEVAELTSKITAESRKANEVIAGQGLPLSELPSASPAYTASKPMTLTEQCLAANRKNLK